MPREVNIITLSLNCANHEIKDIEAAVRYIQEHYILGMPNAIVLATQEDRTGLLDSLGFARSFGKRVYRALEYVPVNDTARNRAISEEIKSAYKHTERSTTLTKPTEPGSLGLLTLVTNALVTPIESIHDIKRNKGVVGQRFLIESPGGNDPQPLKINAGTIHLDSNSDAVRTKQMQEIDSRMRHYSGDDVRPVPTFAQLSVLARSITLLGGDVNTRTKVDGTRPLDSDVDRSRVFPAYLLGYRVGESTIDTYSKPSAKSTPGRREGEKAEGQLDTIMHASGLNIEASEFSVHKNSHLAPPNLFGGKKTNGTDHALVARSFNVKTNTSFPERNTTRAALHAVLRDNCTEEAIDKLDVFLSTLKPTSIADQKIILGLYNTAILMQQMQIKELHASQSDKPTDTILTLQNINTRMIRKLLEFIDNPEASTDFTVRLSAAEKNIITNYNDGPNLNQMVSDFNKTLAQLKTMAESASSTRGHLPMYDQARLHKALPSTEPTHNAPISGPSKHN